MQDGGPDTERDRTGHTLSTIEVRCGAVATEGSHQVSGCSLHLQHTLQASVEHCVVLTPGIWGREGGREGKSVSMVDWEGRGREEERERESVCMVDWTQQMRICTCTMDMGTFLQGEYPGNPVVAEAREGLREGEGVWPREEASYSCRWAGLSEKIETESGAVGTYLDWLLWTMTSSLGNFSAKSM